MSGPDPATWNDPVTVRGVLGWGNRKVGFEAYGPGGRWGGTGRDGDLLGDALASAGCTEGAGLVVVAVDRFAGHGLDSLVDAINQTVTMWLQAQRGG